MWTHCAFMPCWLEVSFWVESSAGDTSLVASLPDLYFIIALWPVPWVSFRACLTWHWLICFLLPGLAASRQRPSPHWERTISPLRKDHLTIERGPSPHGASEPSCIADDSELSFRPWDNPLWVQRKGNYKRSGAITPPQRKDDRHSLGVVLKIIFNSEQNLLILSCMRWDHNNSVLSSQKQFSISVKAPPT